MLEKPGAVLDFAIFIGVLFVVLFGISVGSLYMAMKGETHRPTLPRLLSLQDILLIICLILSFVGTLLGSVLVNAYAQGRLWPTGFLTHYPGGVCGFGVITGILLCGLFLAQLVLIADGRTRILRKHWVPLIIVVGAYAVGQLALNSRLDYYVRRETWDHYKGPGLFEYMRPTYLSQVLYFCILLLPPPSS